MRIATIKTPFLPLWILLFTPAVFPFLPDEIGARSGTFFAIAACFLLLALSKKINIPPKLILIPLITLILYTLSRIFFSDIYTSIEIYDFAEIFRLAGLLIVFFLGNKASNTKNIYFYKTTKKLLFVYSGLTLSLLLPFIFKLESLNPLYELYITRGGRFSGISPSVNYVWFSSLLVSIIAIHSFSRNHIKSPLLALSLLVSVSALIFSGSRTGLISFAAGLTVYWALQLKITPKNIAYTLTIIVLIIFSGNSLFNTLPERTKNRANELANVILYQDTQHSSSLDARYKELKERNTLIKERPLFGHGLSRADEPYFHNSFQRSIYRYGFFGAILEIILLSLFLFYFTKTSKTNNYSILAIPILCAYIIASITSPIFYELRVPYILFFILGLASEKNQKQRSLKEHINKSTESAIIRPSPTA